MAKRGTKSAAATSVPVRATAINFQVNTHDRDELIPEGTKRLDVIVYFGDVIPQRKIRDALAGLTDAQKSKVKAWLSSLVDIALDGHAAEDPDVITETDTEDPFE